MKLERVEFEEFKSISSSSLDIEAGITTLVGINEAGKSNVLRAIEKADRTKKLENFDISRSSDRVYDAQATPKITLEFKLEEKEAEALRPLFGFDASKKLSKLVITKAGNTHSLRYPAIQYDKSSLAASATTAADRKELDAVDAKLKANESAIVVKKGEEVAAAQENKATIAAEIVTLENANKAIKEEKATVEAAYAALVAERAKEKQLKIRGSLIEKLVKEYVPKILFFDSIDIDSFYLPGDGRVEIEKIITEPKKHKPVVNLLKLGGITNIEFLRAGDPNHNLLRTQLLRQASTQINRELMRVHWPLEEVEFVLSAEETNFLSILLREKDTDPTFVPEDRSRGLQWSVAFNIYFLSESQAGELTNTILLIDEPGVFLHIDAQKRLLEKTFPKILDGNNQIIYTTHLPYLIDPKYPERIRILERSAQGGATQIGNKAWSEGRITEIPEPVKTALGTKWTEWFGMSDKSCFVEGPSDQVLLRTLAHKVGSDIDFIPAYGKKSIPSALAIAKLDDKNAIGIIDSDSSKDEIYELKKKLKLVNLPEDSFVDIAELAEDSKIVTVEDIIPESIYRSAVYGLYHQKFEVANVEFKEEDIPVESPRISSWKDFTVAKLGGAGINLEKMELARSVADIVTNMEAPSATAPKWTQVRKIARSVEILLKGKVLLVAEKSEKIENKSAFIQ